ncbi:MAG: hypothetical protein P8Q14_05410 [Vicingaceae bacterium]|nr:hypothetical protein [Vicingaceae bacterium]
MKNLIEILKIIFAAVILSIIYGIIHDLITANISIEYFTIGHPKIIESDSPLTLALLWGVIATWWVGLILGVCISFSARYGKHPKIDLKVIIPLMIKLLLIMGTTAIFAGIIGLVSSNLGFIYLNDKLSSQINESRHHLFLIAGWTHSASYLTGFIGGVVICVKIWKRRKEAKLR